MDFIEGLRNLSARIEKQKDIIETEEATKNAFIMPVINLLGYDVFNPSEVVPEFTADVGTRQGEKVDYAIFNPFAPLPPYKRRSKRESGMEWKASERGRSTPSTPGYLTDISDSSRTQQSSVLVFEKADSDLFLSFSQRNL